MPTLAIVNQKGGCGKTTSALNLACIMASRGQRTLLVDMDAQAHCAIGLSAPETAIDQGMADVLLGQASIESIAWTVNTLLDLAPSTTRLAGVEAARGGLAGAEDRGERLTQALATVHDRYVWRLIDCPPSIGLLTYNALRAADEVLIPVEAGYFALRGAEKQVAALEALDRRTGRETPRRIVLTMHDPERAVCRDVLDQLCERFAGAVVPIAIRWDPAVKEAAALGLGVSEHAPHSHAATDYEALATWLENHVQERHHGVEALHVAVRTPDDPTIENGSTAVATAVEVKQTTLSRAAELVARTRSLTHRSQEQFKRLESDERVARVMRELDVVAGDPTAAPAVDATRLYGARETHRGVLFVFPAGPDVEVAMASDINGWSDSAHRLRFNSAIGAHEICVPFPRGEHLYRYVVNGAWMTDPNNPRTRPNPYGEFDSVVDVKGGAA